MSAEPVHIHLSPDQFGPVELPIACAGTLVATGFRYPSGVAALRLTNELGEIIILPFQGQQIWDATFLGRRLTMRSMFDSPVATRDYLANYGAFFIHCGASAMGNPGPKDSHALHGELPNATYQAVRLIVGTDAAGPHMELTGQSRYTVAFNLDYVAQPTVRLRAGTSHVEAEMVIENRKASAMSLMYLAHINFRPVDGGRIIDTVVDDATGIRARQELPAIFGADSVDHAYRDRLASRPDEHRDFAPGMPVLPELVMSLRMEAGEDGWAHALQRHPDGTADFVSHRPEQLPHAVRWITRGPDQDALGLILPATADSEGFLSAKANGRLVKLAPQEAFRCELRFGALDSTAAVRAEQQIVAIRANHAPTK